MRDGGEGKKEDGEEDGGEEEVDEVCIKYGRGYGVRNM